MRRALIPILISGVFYCASSPAVLAVNTPISTPVSGSIIRHNGLYYALSTEGDGLMYQSKNLIDWTDAGQVLPAGIKGPFDLTVRNGLVHLYAQDAGYAYSCAPDKPFSKLYGRGQERFDTRLFQDKGGELLCVMREPNDRLMGKVKDAGDIVLQRHNAPWKPYGTPRSLLKSRPGMWDALDGTGLGMPELFNYRGNYHLLFSANDPDPRIGLREIGVAAKDDPLDIDNKDIEPNILLAGNASRLSEAYRALLPSGEYTIWKGRYVFEAPDDEWNRPGFVPVRWLFGEGGFGSPDELRGVKLQTIRTKWETPRIWVRREFDLPEGAPSKLVLNLRHGGAVQVFLNGVKVHESRVSSPTYSYIALPEKLIKLLQPRNNVLAVHAVATVTDGYHLLDFGLYDAADHPVESAVYGPDAPRVVTGPNGFEKWMTYQAFWNGKSGRGLDRVYFHDDRMVVDGPTTPDTPGYHPAPARPTYSDDFEQKAEWSFGAGQWNVTNGILRQKAVTGSAFAQLEQDPARHYLFETNLRFPQGGKGKAGVVAWSDGKNNLVVWISPSEHEWGYFIGPGRAGAMRHKLPEQFRFLELPPGSESPRSPWHRLKITKNGGYFDVMLDEFRLTSKKPIITKLNVAGVPGLFCQNASADFDGVTFTKGWDEHDEYITGWGSAANGVASSGAWRHDEDTGLEQRKKSEPGRAFKGDLLDQYEFTVNARSDGLEQAEDCSYGIIPVFSDEKNYLQAMVDSNKRQLVVSGRRKGAAVGPFAVPLTRTIPLRPLISEDVEYRFLTSWVYELPSLSIISGMKVRWLEGQYDHLRQSFYVPEGNIQIRYAAVPGEPHTVEWGGGSMYDADIPKYHEQQPGILNPMQIREQQGNYVGVGPYVDSSYSTVVDSITKEFLRFLLPGDILDPELEKVVGQGGLNGSSRQSRPQEARATVELESSYFFRCVKLKDKVIIELNGNPMLTVEGEWPPSQVGLLTKGQSCFFNGITLMHLPE